MATISDTIEAIKATAARIGLLELSRRSGVPYTTLRSFHDREWGHKNLEAFEKLAAVCEQESAEGGEKGAKARRVRPAKGAA